MAGKEGSETVAQVLPMAVGQFHDLREAGTPYLLLDVRTDEERALASLPEAVPLESSPLDRLRTLAPGVPIVVMCHHGIRSRAFAGRLVLQGLSPVYNLEGGIDAWSRHIDPSVPRY